MDKLKELLEKRKCLDNEISEHKQKLCNDALTSFGLKIGDTVEAKGKRGIIYAIFISWNSRFELRLRGVKKDGTESKNNINIFAPIEDFKKVCND